MSARPRITPHSVHIIAITVCTLCVARDGYTQSSNAWTGIAADEARPIGEVQWDPLGVNQLSPHSLSSDGRFIVFGSRARLVADDTNDDWDVYLRDRQTGAASRISVAMSGSDPNGPSAGATISADGRHVAFWSCASNLVVADENGLCDVFVFDRERLRTSRVNIGPKREESVVWDTTALALSGDGRYVLFVSGFELSPYVAEQRLWLHDRDPDGNGVFDQPGSISVSELPTPAMPGLRLVGYGSLAISDDGQYVAFSPDAYTLDGQYLGTRLFMHDRQTGMMAPVVNAPFDRVTFTTQPDFSNIGHLVYVSDVPNLVAGDDDFDADLDVFVFNFLGGDHRRIQLTHANAPPLVESRMPAISADGLYVTFVGVHMTPEGIQWSNVYVFDREMRISHDVSVKPDGLRVDNVGDYPSISDDGTAIAFIAAPYMLVEEWGNDGVFVATSVSLAPAAIDVSAEGTAQMNVAAPANTAWTIKIVDVNSQVGLLQVTPTSGVGPATLDIALPPNFSEDDREYWIAVGSEATHVRQLATPMVWWTDPGDGPATGGTPVAIHGAGFKQGATVSFGGQPASDVVVENNGVIRAVTPIHGLAAAVDVVVTNPNGASGVLSSGFTYYDATPPIITSTVSGTLGANGWYNTNVSVSWTVRDDESPLQYQDCENFVVDYDTTDARVACNAMSEGGRSSEELHIKRDTKTPSIGMTSPEARTYMQGEQITASFSCQDATSGVATCVGSTANGSLLDTASPGTYTFVVTAEDHAGLRTTVTVAYTVKGVPAIAWPAPSNITYGTALNVTQLNATAGVPGTFAYTPGAGAVLPAGSHTLSVTFTPADAGAYVPATATTIVTVGPAPLTILANNEVKAYGEALPAFSATATEFVNGDTFSSLTGVLSFTTNATNASAPGAYAISVTGVSSPNYSIRFVSGTLAVVKALTAVSLSAAPNPVKRQETNMQAVISYSAPYGNALTGMVEFREGGALIGVAPVVNGVATLSYRFRRATSTVTAAYSGDVNFQGSAVTATLATR